MAELKPFRAIRPAQGLEDKIAALPYDVYSSAEAREVVKEEPMSFLRIDRAETQLPEGVDIYLDESLRRFDPVYPAAGSDNSAVRVSIAELERFSRARGWVDVSKLPE